MSWAFDVTVVVPTYQGARHIADCLESIAAQDLDGVEVLVIDDCSTDDTVAIAESFRDRIANLRVLRNDLNVGAVANVNRCIEAARGRWVKPVFQDDMIDPSCLTTMRAARRPRVPVVICARRYLYEGEVPEHRREACENLLEFALVRRLGRGFVDRERLSDVVAEQAAEGLPHINLVGEPVVGLFERRVLLASGGVDDGYVQLWDYEMVLRLGLRRGLVLLDEPLATFRVHGGSATARNFSDMTFRSNVMDRLRIHLAFARDWRFRTVRQAALRRRPPADLLAEAYGVAQAARTVSGWLPEEQRAEARGQLDRISILLPTPPPGPAGDVAFRSETALLHELSSGPWLALPEPGPEPAPEAEPSPGEKVRDVPEPQGSATQSPTEGGGLWPGVPGPLVGVRPVRTAARMARALRAKQWWGHMLGPIVAFAAMQIGWRQIPPGIGLGRVVALTASAVALASYGYVVNDAADVAQDRRAGKRNSMAPFPLPARLAVIAVFAVLGALPWVFFHLPTPALVVLAGIYLMPLLYSAYPVRLKERHVLGPLADASNAFVLPALFTISLFAPFGDTAGPAPLMVVGAVMWAAGFGLRAIVKHQVDDAVNDRAAGASTWVLDVGEGRAIEVMRCVLFPVEVVGLILLVATVATWSWGTAALGVGIFAVFQGLRLGGVIDRRLATLSLAWGGWLYWQQIWPALLVSVGLAVWDPWYLLLTALVCMLFWPRLLSGLRRLRVDVTSEVRAHLARRRARRPAGRPT